MYSEVYRCCCMTQISGVLRVPCFNILHTVAIVSPLRSFAVKKGNDQWNISGKRYPNSKASLYESGLLLTCERIPCVHVNHRFFRRSSARSLQVSWIFPDNLMEFFPWNAEFQGTGRQTYWSEWRNRLYCSPPQRSMKISYDLCRNPRQVVKLASPSGRKSSNSVLPNCVFLQEHVYK